MDGKATREKRRREGKLRVAFWMDLNLTNFAKFFTILGGT